MIDYHIHTPLCNHAHGPMEDYVCQAIQKGIREICFLDHLILDGPGMKHSMTAKEVPLYVNSVARLRDRYRDQIVVRTGLEVDYLPEKRGEIDEIIGMYAFDVIGGSYHFVKGLNVASRKEPPKIGKHEEKKLV
jgi:histidinol-phosphatase (PHP family)